MSGTEATNSIKTEFTAETLRQLIRATSKITLINNEKLKELAILIATQQFDKALFFIVDHGLDLAYAEILITAGANVNAQIGEDKETLLIRAACEGNTKAIEFLLNKGAHIDMCDENGFTPLISATDRNQTSAAMLLVERGANIHARDTTEYENDSLSLAAVRGNTVLINYFIDKGADINAVDSCKATALIRAAQAGELEAVKLLVERGANIYMKAIFVDFTSTAEDYARDSHESSPRDPKYRQVAEFLREIREKAEAAQKPASAPSQGDGPG